MRLLVDLGNSRIKWLFADAGEPVRKGSALVWREGVDAGLAQAWSGASRPDVVLAASVAGAAREALLERIVADRFALPVDWVRTPAAAGGVRNGYARPSDLGVDRFLGLLAAWREQHAPCVLVSCGTALVTDALADDGQHLGGWIAPGARLMQQALCAATGIRASGAGQLVDVAAGTDDAVASGAWQACAALVGRFRLRVRDRLGGSPRVLLAGGDAPELAPLLDLPVTRFPNAVLRGLAAWADMAE